jgi:type IV secretion system protein TrbG
MSIRAALLAGLTVLEAASFAGDALAQTPLATISAANAEARRRPQASAFVDATQLYDYAPGAIYEVYAAPGYLSTLVFEPGETLQTIAAGDTTRWLVEEAASSSGGQAQPILLLKPTRGALRTNLVVVTDRRTYLIEVIAVDGRDYSAQVAWRYPRSNDTLLGGETAAATLNFAYHIRTVRGARPRWLPLRVYDDGQRTYIEFPETLSSSEAPPLFTLENNEPALVNYRVVDGRYVVDRLLDVAELRLGSTTPTIVRISRDGAATPPPQRRRRG